MWILLIWIEDYLINPTDQPDSNLIFPHLEYRTWKLLVLGTYQIKHAWWHYSECVRYHGGYRIEICRENIHVDNERNNALIRGIIKSRHITRKYIHILIENNVPDRKGIIK